MRSLLVLAAVALAAAAHAEKATVCTVTVNSADEREAFRQYLPEDRYRFVELVEHGRPDWLASACERKVRCDVLIVSGHFAGNEFYSSRFDVDETLPVDEIERVACSASCPDLFSQLKEVYLFGCDSLKPEPVKSAMPEIIRGLVKEGHSQAEAESIARALSERNAESSRARMRRVFPNVPVIYGFSSLAPYGRIAGPMLSRYFQSDGAETIGTGQISPKLLALFAPASMVVTSGLAPSDANADYRAEACHYYDDRITTAGRVDFIHEVFARDMPQVRIAFDRIEKFFTHLTPEQRAEPASADAIDRLGADRSVREHYLGITRDTQDPALRLRMIALAANVGWLAPAEQRAEELRLVADVLASRDMGFPEVDLVCGLNDDHSLEPAPVALSQVRADTAPRAAALACLGEQGAHARVLEALASSDEREVQIAQAYLRHRPIETGELRKVAASIAGMTGTSAQVRALETLARQHIADPATFEALKQLYARTRSPAVQGAIAEIFLRAGAAALDDRDLAALLRQHRVKAPAATGDLVDILIRRLQASQPG
ncbi:MAG: hypothetical protein ACM3X5_02050 [Bacillota bacterium]